MKPNDETIRAAEDGDLESAFAVLEWAEKVVVEAHKKEKGHDPDDESILLVDGGYYKPFRPDPKDINPDAVAHALGNICRWTGHTTRHFSVAEHCTRMSEQLERDGESPEVVLKGHLHDAAESMVCDVSRPIRRHPLMRSYNRAMELNERVFGQRFGFSDPYPPEVALADDRMLMTEAYSIMPAFGEHFKSHAMKGADPYDDMIDVLKNEPLSPQEAAEQWLKRLHFLLGKR